MNIRVTDDAPATDIKKRGRPLLKRGDLPKTAVVREGRHVACRSPSEKALLQ